MEGKQQSMFRTVFGMMINPADTIKGALSSTRWYVAIGVSALAFALFFVQTGLDLYNTGQKDLSYVLLAGGAGLLYGAIVIPLLGVLVWLPLKATNVQEDVRRTMATFCLSYCGALIYGLLGLGFSLILGWKTAMAFGVTGVLWAIGPMIVGIREMTGGKNALSIPIATVISALVLISWSFLGNM